MVDNNETKKKLDALFHKICEDECIFTKNEAIKMFKENDFYEEIEIRPIKMDYDYEEEINIDFDDEEYEDDYEEEINIDFDDEEYEDDYDDDFDDEVLYYSDDIIEELDEYQDEQEFFIDLPEEVACEFSSNNFKKGIFSNLFLSEEREYIINMLIDGTRKHCENKALDISIDDSKKLKQFINNCSINDFISVYANDVEFSKLIFNIYTIIAFEKQKNISNETIIQSLNDLIREKLSLIHNSNIRHGYNNTKSIEIILKLIDKKIPTLLANEMYKKQLGCFKIEDLGNQKYIKTIIISDYLRMCELKYKEFGELDNIENEYLEFIDKNNKEQILNRFNNDIDFASNMTLEFLELNSYCSINTKKSCTNMKLIKKINPLYGLDFMEKTISEN